MRKSKFGFCLFYREPGKVLNINWKILSAIANPIRDLLSTKPGFAFEGEIIITLDSTIEKPKFTKETLKKSTQYTIILPYEPFVNSDNHTVLFVGFVLQGVGEFFKSYLNAKDLEVLSKNIERDVVQNPRYRFEMTTDLRFATEFKA